MGKTVAMEGMLRLLEQVTLGVPHPAVDCYTPVDVAGTDLCNLLQSVDALFARCGGAREAFTSASLQGTLQAFLEDGKLEMHDIDVLSQQFSSSRFVSYDGPADALRLFEFLELLQKVGARVFPGEEPRSALNGVLKAVSVIGREGNCNGEK